jgi:biopolymer transport protein ExbD
MNNKRTLSTEQQPNLMVYINTTPLIDVMLVLLIMLIITIPIRLHSVNLDLPEKNADVITSPKNSVEISIDQFGEVKIDNRIVQNKEDLKIIFIDMATKTPNRNIVIDSHAKSNYGDVATILFEARKAGIQEIGFIGIERFQ